MKNPLPRLKTRDH